MLGLKFLKTISTSLSRSFHQSVSIGTTSKIVNISKCSANSFFLPVCNRKLMESSSPIQLPLYKPKNQIIDDFPIKNIIVENPRTSMLNEIRDILNNKEIYEPPSIHNKNDNTIQAARLIVIRRRKMKKHKLKKLRKKMKFEWAKVRQRREMRKEKAFQAVLIAQIKDAEKFSAEQFVFDKLKQANETPIPRFWKGRRLPQFIIKEKLGIK